MSTWGSKKESTFSLRFDWKHIKGVFRDLVISSEFSHKFVITYAKPFSYPYSYLSLDNWKVYNKI